jgi:hypothetical protein
MNFLSVTPLLTMFHRFMGMRLGRRVQIKTSIIGDSNLIAIGDDTVIGGDGAMIAANAVDAKGTTIGLGEVWGGVPARRLK